MRRRQNLEDINIFKEVIITESRERQNVIVVFGKFSKARCSEGGFNQ